MCHFSNQGNYVGYYPLFPKKSLKCPLSVSPSLFPPSSSSVVAHNLTDHEPTTSSQILPSNPHPPAPHTSAHHPKGSWSSPTPLHRRRIASPRPSLHERRRWARQRNVIVATRIKTPPRHHPPRRLPWTPFPNTIAPPFKHCTNEYPIECLFCV